MKRVLILISLLLIVISYGYGQQDAGIPGQSKPANTKGTSGDHKGFISVSVGPALPMGEFGVTDTNASGSPGFAKSGFGMMLNVGYRIIKNVGVTAAFLRSSHNVEADGVDLSDNSSPWTYGGFLAGGWLTTHNSSFNVDGRIMAGYANASTPDFGGFLVQESAGSFAFMAGIGAKYLVLKPLFITVNVDYFNTKPYFSQSDFDQPIGVLNITGGIGVELF
jgi:hypothetical protein